MDETRDYYPKIGKSEKDKHYVISLICEIQYKWACIWKRNRFTDIENRFVIAKRGGWLGREGLKVLD